MPNQAAAAIVPYGYIRATVVLCLGTFLLACATPATTIGTWGPFDGPTFGYAHLLFGWIPDPSCILHWAANPIGLAALVYFMKRRFRVAAWLSLVAFIAAITTLFSGMHDVFWVGFYLWLACPMILGVCAAIAGWFGGAIGRFDTCPTK